MFGKCSPSGVDPPSRSQITNSLQTFHNLPVSPQSNPSLFQNLQFLHTPFPPVSSSSFRHFSSICYAKMIQQCFSFSFIANGNEQLGNESLHHAHHAHHAQQPGRILLVLDGSARVSRGRCFIQKHEGCHVYHGV